MLSIKRILRSPDGAGGEQGGLTPPRFPSCTYRGSMNSALPEVWFENAISQSSAEPPERHSLPPRLDVCIHSEEGFAWGYGGSAPAQLALALLIHALSDEKLALAHYQSFKLEHVSKWGDEWSITADQIRRFVVEFRQVTPEAQFSPGDIMVTPAARAALADWEILQAFTRHLHGDWGELDRHDWNANNEALSDGSRLLSAYDSEAGERFWIITEADRSVTTVLLPNDY